MALLLIAVIFLAFLMQPELGDGYVQRLPEFVDIRPTCQSEVSPSWLTTSSSFFFSLSCLVHRMRSFNALSFTRNNHRSEMVWMCVWDWGSVGLWMMMLEGVDGYTQSQPKLVGTGASGSAGQGRSTAVSGDGLTACVGGYSDNSNKGAVWFYTRGNAGTFTWSQQGSKIVPSDGTGSPVLFGYSSSLSFNGSVAVVGGYYDNNQIGATWIITRDGSGVWTQMGSKRVGTGYTSTSPYFVQQGISISIASTAANVYVTGGYHDNSDAGATWVFSLSGGVWSQVGSKLVGSSGSSTAYQGNGVAISADAITIAVGGYNDGSGSVWIFTLSGSTYVQQGGKFTPSPASSDFGYSVALSADGTTLVGGDPYDSSSIGAMNVFTRSVAGVWYQQGGKIVGTTYVGSTIYQGYSIAIAANGNIAAVGGWYDNSSIGATWVFTRDINNIWAQYGPKLVGSGYAGTSIDQGNANGISLSADGSILFVGGVNDNSGIGAAWAFNDPSFIISTALPCTRPTNTASTSYGSCASPIPNGTVCTPTCTASYTASNNLSILCNNGTLSTPLGVCNPNCMSLFTPLTANANYGTCTTNYPSGSSCSIACGSTSYLSSGSLTATCSTAGTWTPPSGVCTPNPCSTPSDSSSTSYSSVCSASILSGLSCTPICQNGYTASGPLNITCSYGTFSSPAGVCNPNPCARPANTLSTIYTVASCFSSIPSGSICTPACQLGYSNVSGPIDLTCSLGNFSTPVGSCVGNPCSKPSNTASTTYASCAVSTPSGQTCVPSCLSGYTASGDLTITCTAGTFSSAAGVCNPNPCARPSDTASTIYSIAACPSPTPSGSQCTPSCQTGYTANGSLAMTCTLGAFSAAAGMCNANPCAVPSNTASTTYNSCLSPTPSGQTCVPTCVSGYSPSASLAITCSLGTFSSPAGVCAPNPCASPTPPYPVTVGGCGSSTASGSSCVLGCATGFVANGSLSVTCTLGAFSIPTGNCSLSVSPVCSQPTPSLPLTPGTCPPSAPNGTTCTLGCAPGYSPHAGEIFNVTCDNSAYIIDASAVCDEDPCSLPSFAAGMTQGTCLASQPGSTACYFACTAGHTQSGSLNMTCTVGSYSALQGSCLPNPCPQSSLPLSTGQTAGNCPAVIPSGSPCTISCASGYMITGGTVNATCSLGVFAVLPTSTCVANACPLPSFPASLNQGSCASPQNSNTSCYFACSSGYTLSAGGSLNVTCSAGMFSAIIGSCNPNPCLQPAPAASSAMTVGNCPAQTLSGSSCSLGCIGGFTTFGVRTTTCTAGTFTPDGAGYCVGVAGISTSTKSLPNLVASPGTVLTITLNQQLGNPPTDMVVSNYTVNGMFALPAFAMPDLGVQNTTATLLVYVTSVSLGVVDAILTAFQASVQFYEPPVLKSVCPDSITAQIIQTVIVQGSGFAFTPTLSCIMEGAFVFPALYSVTNPGSVTCELNWPNTTAGQVVLLNVANDGSIDSIGMQMGLPITIKGACESVIAGSISTPKGCKCPAGSYDNGGACQLCANGFYQSTIGAASCLSCGENQDTNFITGCTSQSACVCRGLYFPQPRTGKCITCVEGMLCPGNNVIDIRPGYWRASSSTARVVPCPGGSISCIGTTNSSSLCAPGYAGPICTVCAEGYAKLGTICVQCPKTGLNAFALIVLVIFASVFAYFLIQSASSFEDDGSKSSEEKAEKQRQGSIEVIVKVALNYTQVLYYIGRLTSNWSDLVHRFFAAVGILSALSPNNYTIHCAANWHFYDSLVVMYVSPIIIVSILTVVYFFRHFIRSLEFKQSKTDYQLAVMLLLYQIHPTIMLEVINSFPCEHVGGTHTSYLKADMSVDCKSPQYKTYAAVSAIYLIFYVFGMLVLTVLRLRFNFKAGKLANRSHSAFVKYAFFFVGYRSRTYYWEAVIMLRKMGVVAFSVFPSAMLQLVFANIIIMFALLLNKDYIPFASQFINRIESFSLGALLCTITLGFLFINAGNGATNTVWISVLVILVNTAMAAFLLVVFVKRLRHALRKFTLKLPSWLRFRDEFDGIVYTKNPRASTLNSEMEMISF